MFKLLALACIFAITVAAPAPGGLVVGPVAHVAHVSHVAPVAVSHSSSHIVHNPPVVKTVVAHHAIPVAHAVPIIHHAPVVAHHVAVAPVVRHVVAHPVLVHH